MLFHYILNFHKGKVPGADRISILVPSRPKRNHQLPIVSSSVILIESLSIAAQHDVSGVICRNVAYYRIFLACMYCGGRLHRGREQH